MLVQLDQTGGPLHLRRRLDCHLRWRGREPSDERLRGLHLDDRRLLPHVRRAEGALDPLGAAEDLTCAGDDHRGPEPRLLVHRRRVDAERVRVCAEHLAHRAVLELDLHVVEDLVDAAEPVRLLVHHERAGTARGQRLQHFGGHTAELRPVMSLAVAQHAHPHDDARLPQLVARARDDVPQQEHAVEQREVACELRAQALLLAPPHLCTSRRKLAASVVVVVDDGVLILRLLVATVRRALHNPDLVKAALMVLVLHQVVGEDDLLGRHTARQKDDESISPAPHAFEALSHCSFAWPASSPLPSPQQRQALCDTSPSDGTPGDAIDPCLPARPSPIS
mmetsp:Transcript_14887/g.37132  ORF Transcript_14887/g.37132 Transcript_14887/m.37132 type:complete len:336 (+) Transcript_14887:2659-3666(+)